jgi:hypothetical protein
MPTEISYGHIWTKLPRKKHWTNIALSSDGNNLVGITRNRNLSPGYIYTSNNGGLNWIRT